MSDNAIANIAIQRGGTATLRDRVVTVCDELAGSVRMALRQLPATMENVLYESSFKEGSNTDSVVKAAVASIEEHLNDFSDRVNHKLEDFVAMLPVEADDDEQFLLTILKQLSTMDDISATDMAENPEKVRLVDREQREWMRRASVMMQQRVLDLSSQVRHLKTLLQITRRRNNQRQSVVQYLHATLYRDIMLLHEQVLLAAGENPRDHKERFDIGFVSFLDFMDLIESDYFSEYEKATEPDIEREIRTGVMNESRVVRRDDGGYVVIPAVMRSEAQMIAAAAENKSRFRGAKDLKEALRGENFAALERLMQKWREETLARQENEEQKAVVQRLVGEAEELEQKLKDITARSAKNISQLRKTNLDLHQKVIRLDRDVMKHKGENRQMSSDLADARGEIEVLESQMTDMKGWMELKKIESESSHMNQRGEVGAMSAKLEADARRINKVLDLLVNGKFESIDQLRRFMEEGDDDDPNTTDFLRGLQDVKVFDDQMQELKSQVETFDEERNAFHDRIETVENIIDIAARQLREAGLPYEEPLSKFIVNKYGDGALKRSAVDEAKLREFHEREEAYRELKLVLESVASDDDDISGWIEVVAKKVEPDRTKKFAGLGGDDDLSPDDVQRTSDPSTDADTEKLVGSDDASPTIPHLHPTAASTTPPVPRSPGETLIRAHELLRERVTSVVSDVLDSIDSEKKTSEKLQNELNAKVRMLTSVQQQQRAQSELMDTVFRMISGDGGDDSRRTSLFNSDGTINKGDARKSDAGSEDGSPNNRRKSFSSAAKRVLSNVKQKTSPSPSPQKMHGGGSNPQHRLSIEDAVNLQKRQSSASSSMGFPDSDVEWFNALKEMNNRAVDDHVIKNRKVTRPSAMQTEDVEFVDDLPPPPRTWPIGVQCDPPPECIESSSQTQRQEGDDVTTAEAVQEYLSILSDPMSKSDRRGSSVMMLPQPGNTDLTDDGAGSFRMQRRFSTAGESSMVRSRRLSTHNQRVVCSSCGASMQPNSLEPLVTSDQHSQTDEAYERQVSSLGASPSSDPLATTKTLVDVNRPASPMPQSSKPKAFISCQTQTDTPVVTPRHVEDNFAQVPGSNIGSHRSSGVNLRGGSASSVRKPVRVPSATATRTISRSLPDAVDVAAPSGPQSLGGSPRGYTRSKSPVGVSFTPGALNIDATPGSLSIQQQLEIEVADEGVQAEPETKGAFAVANLIPGVLSLAHLKAVRPKSIGIQCLLGQEQLNSDPQSLQPSSHMASGSDSVIPERGELPTVSAVRQFDASPRVRVGSAGRRSFASSSGIGRQQGTELHDERDVSWHAEGSLSNTQTTIMMEDFPSMAKSPGILSSAMIGAAARALGKSRPGSRQVPSAGTRRSNQQRVPVKTLPPRPGSHREESMRTRRNVHSAPFMRTNSPPPPMFHSHIPGDGVPSIPNASQALVVVDEFNDETLPYDTQEEVMRAAFRQEYHHSLPSVKLDRDATRLAITGSRPASGKPPRRASSALGDRRLQSGVSGIGTGPARDPR